MPLLPLSPLSAAPFRRPAGRRLGAATLIAGGVVSAVLALSLEPAVAGADTPAAPPAGSIGQFLPGLGSSGTTTPVPATPRLSSVPNFRDVGGTGAGYVTRDGRHVHRGVFYRANAITPNDADLATLQGLGITQVYDVRTDAEVKQAPDRLPAGEKYVRIPILSGDLNAAVAQLKTPDDAKAFMQKMERSFVTDASNRQGFATLLTDLANNSGPQVFHCTAGKDRTGWAAALLLSIAGASPQTVMQDYLATNDYLTTWMQQNYDAIKASQGQTVADIYKPLLGVEADYLQAGLDQVKQSYGSIDNYLTKGLGLDPGTIGKLHAKLVG